MKLRLGRRTALFALAQASCLTPDAATRVNAGSVQGLASRRAAELGPGINLSRWRAPLDRSRGDGDGPSDLARVVALGFRHVRLPVDPAPAMARVAEGHSGAASATSGLDRFVDGLAADVATILSKRLRVIVDMHPDDQFRSRLANDASERDRFAETWEAVALRLGRQDPERVIFEPLNEPGEAIGTAWPALQDKLLQSIRRAAPRHTILAVGALWSTIGDLRTMPPCDDPNLIYAYHFYSPMVFTHQGADWSGGPYDRLRGVPYPLSIPEIERLSAATEPQYRAKIEEEARGGRGWAAARVDTEIALAGEWARERRLPVICTEFGAYIGDGARAADRVRYLSDVRAALSRHARAWTMWDYSGGFGVARPGALPDRAVLRALGLLS